MARTPRIDIAMVARGLAAGGLAVALKLLAIVLFLASVVVAEDRAAPSQTTPRAVVVTNPYVSQSPATVPRVDTSAEVPNTPAVTAGLHYPVTTAETVINPYVTPPIATPSDWNPPVVENPFSPNARISSRNEPLRWGPVSRWRSPNGMESKKDTDFNIDADLFPLMPLEVPLRLAPTGAAEADALSTAFGVEQTQENANASGDNGLPPDPKAWVSNEIKQPAWLQTTEPVASPVTSPNIVPAVAIETDRWHAPDEGPFDPFEEPSFDEPNIEAAFVSDDIGVSDDAGPSNAQPSFRTPLQKSQAVAQTLDPETSPAFQPPSSRQRSPANALQWAQQRAQSAKSLGDFAVVVGKCDTFLAAQPTEELAAEARQLSAWAHNRIGELLADDFQPGEAMQEFAIALQLDPANSLALHNRAIHLAEQGEYEQALRDFSAAIQQNPGLKIAYRNRAELLSVLGQSQAAIEDYTSALKHQPDDEQLLVLRAHALHRVREYPQAMADFNAALRLVPTNPDAYTGRGNLHAEMGNYQSAIEDYRQALLADANWGDAYRSLAWLLATCPDPKYQNPRRAMVAARQAAKFGSKEDPFVLEALAAASASAGQFRAATELQQRALAVAPELVASRMEHRLALYQQDQPFLSGQPSDVQQASFEE